MNIKSLLALIGLCIILGVGYAKPDLFTKAIQNTVLRFQNIEDSLPFVESIKKEVNLPGPLKETAQNFQNTNLTRSGVISWTNTMRDNEGLPTLSENELLNASAQKKLEDMFEKQYFEHVAPNGTTPTDVIVSVGYEYITTGENLALGNFKDDEALVQGWMDSPGHRANILNKKYQEIGVAVGEGMYQGKRTWLAVQHFGKPLSSCPYPDDNIKNHIDELVANAEELKMTIDSQKQELENSDPKSEDERQSYNQKVDEYNQNVSEYNSLLDTLKSQTANYNNQVNEFNSCADEGN